MNARMYDPILGRMLAPDNYIMGGTQGYNRYTYALNNPLKFNDPSGQWVHIVIGAVVGGFANLIVKDSHGQINSWSDGLMAFGIGAVAGAVGAATGGVAFTVAGGAAAGGGGFLAGAAGGAVGTAFSTPIQSMGNTACFGDPVMTQKQWLTGVGIGLLIGGTINGGIAVINGKNFWNGNLPNDRITRIYIEPLPIRKLKKIGGDGVGQIELKGNTSQTNIEYGTVKGIDYEQVYGKLMKHSFSQQHIGDGVLTIGNGSRLGTMDVAVKVIEYNQNLLVNGSNEIIVNGGQYTVRCFAQNGQVINANIFSGTSSRTLGNLIYFNIR